MIIRDDFQSLEISALERRPSATQPDLDFGLDIAAMCGTFSGRNENAWVHRSDWNQFARDLAEVEQTRKGQAVISSMSPHDLRLRIFASDNAGHVMAEGWVGRDYSTRSGVVEHRVSFRIEIDPTTLSRLAQELESLAPAV